MTVTRSTAVRNNPPILMDEDNMSFPHYPSLKVSLGVAFQTTEGKRKDGDTPLVLIGWNLEDHTSFYSHSYCRELVTWSYLDITGPETWIPWLESYVQWEPWIMERETEILGTISSYQNFASHPLFLGMLQRYVPSK